MNASPAWLDGALYPDLAPPERVETLDERVDFLARLCAAWDFDLLPEEEIGLLKERLERVEQALQARLGMEWVVR